MSAIKERNRLQLQSKKHIFFSISEQKLMNFLARGKVILEQLKKRRKELGLLQKDMLLRVGMTRQQYNQLENKGNPRLDTLSLLAKGLGMELMLIPKEKLDAVRQILTGSARVISITEDNEDGTSLSDDPWRNILEDET